ncbi:protein YgfX [Oceanisphaera sp. IT1-181]|uniref:protein YgfX n=1 Tax=Oceanisphaera sp. IT1-181 TaxID=3081199 RepID=UPI0029CA5125|nr:protein YgfX [Oceanisphaera sp. IT1-181]
MSVTRFEISAKPSLYHLYYLLAVASLWWLPASFLLRADILPWFTTVWLLVCGLLYYRSRAYALTGEYNQGVISLNTRSGRLSHHSRVGPGFLVLMLDEQRLPAFWLFQDALPEPVYRRLTQLILQADPSRKL